MSTPVYPVLEGKVAIVTGAAMGMGEATARLFAEAGAKVVVADFNDELGTKVAESIVADGGQAAFTHVDVSNEAEVEAMVKFAVDTYGRLDAAVNNAARAPDQGGVHEFDPNVWDGIMAVDFKGVALCMKYEILQLRAQGDGGSIINISSVSGFRPQPNNPAYVAAKHAVVGLTKAAALENGMEGIRINSVAPGAIDTPHAARRDRALRLRRRRLRPAALDARPLRAGPRDRAGQPLARLRPVVVRARHDAAGRRRLHQPLIRPSPGYLARRRVDHRMPRTTPCGAFAVPCTCRPTDGIST